MSYQNLTEEKLSKQPVLILATLGSVGVGKSKLIRSLTGTSTQRSTEEQKNNNCTKECGYANMKIWHIPSLPLNKSLFSTNGKKQEFTYQGEKGILVHHISFVDNPGHQEFIKNMLAGVGGGVDGAIVVVDGSNTIENQQQLQQHLIAGQLANINDPIFCLNKLDLIEPEISINKFHQLNSFCKKIGMDNSTCIPTSFTKNIGIQELLLQIMKKYPPPIDRLNSDNSEIIGVITRSFDVTKSGVCYNKVKGGAIGGALHFGKVKIGDEIEIRPGFVSQDEKGNMKAQPIKTKVLSLQTEKSSLDEIVPGGLIAIGTNIDPFFTTKNKLSGSIIGIPGKMPSIYSNIKINFNSINNYVSKVQWEPKTNDIIHLTVKALHLKGRITNLKKRTMDIKLSRPLPIREKDSVIICNEMNGLLTPVGKGTLKKGTIITN